MKFLRGDERNDRPIEADHAADAGVDEDEQRKLLPVRTDPQLSKIAARRRPAHLSSVRASAAIRPMK